MIGPTATRCVRVAAVTVLGIGLRLYSAGDVLASLVFSGILVLLLGAVLLSGFAVWQGGKWVVEFIESWNSEEPPPRPPVFVPGLKVPDSMGIPQ
jgi:hypothetical protein